MLRGIIARCHEQFKADLAPKEERPHLGEQKYLSPSSGWMITSLRYFGISRALRKKMIDYLYCHVRTIERQPFARKTALRVSGLFTQEAKNVRMFIPCNAS